MTQKQKLIVLLATLGLALSACSEKKTEATAAAAAAVKVNGQVISGTEFQLKGGTHKAAADKAHAISEPAMQSMLNAELLRQAALESKLDAEESVRARIAISMRSILATAYLEKLLADVAKPSDADISAYYDQHPERFSNRKQLTMKEVVIQHPTGKEAEIQAALGKAKKAADFEKWLQANQIAFNSAPVTSTTDQMAEEALQKLKDVPVGGSAILEGMAGTPGMQVIFVLDAQPQPLTLAKVSPVIVNMIMEKGRKDVMDSTIKSLRDKAKIEYVAPYSEKGLANAGTK